MRDWCSVGARLVPGWRAIHASGKPAATLLYLGPGLANGLANLHNARRAASPIVNIAGFARPVSAEHGIGLEKRDYPGWSCSIEEIALMRRLKTMLDPNGILNPGKVLAAWPDAIEAAE